jgi:hypothetical protein
MAPPRRCRPDHRRAGPSRDGGTSSGISSRPTGSRWTSSISRTEYLRASGLEAGKDYQVQRFDVLVGKHGDHIGGELDAFKHLASGKAAASAMLDLNWTSWTANGTVNGNEFEILATTDRFDHCVFAVSNDFPEQVKAAWLEVLFSMSYDNPKHREMMDMEGLKAWVPGRTSGFRQYLDRVKVRQLVLEYATARAGDLMALAAPELGLGVVNPRTEVVEAVDDVKRSIERALALYRPDRLFVNPDCGFATFSNRPVNRAEIAVNKMKTIAEAVKAFR